MMKKYKRMNEQIMKGEDVSSGSEAGAWGAIIFILIMMVLGFACILMSIPE